MSQIPQAQADGLSWRGTDQGDKLKTAADCFGGSNCGSSGFEGFSAGYRDDGGGTFAGRGVFPRFWSSSISGINAWARLLHTFEARIHRAADNQAFGFSVRCLKD